MKRLSLQWRITIMTALLTCAACVLTNCLVGYTGMRYMDAIGSDISAFNAASADSPQVFDPTKTALDDKVTIVVNDAQESFGTTAWYITAGVTLLGGALAYFVSGRALKPLRAFAAQVERVQPDNLSEIRLSEDVPTELQRCSASFNDMIARLGEGFSAQPRSPLCKHRLNYSSPSTPVCNPKQPSCSACYKNKPSACLE